MLADTLTESYVFWTFLLRFCAGVAEREREYSMVFTVSNAHDTFGEKVGFVMILDTFRAPVGSLLAYFVYFWVAFLQCCFLPLSR